jgi:hypothetical protein
MEYKSILLYTNYKTMYPEEGEEKTKLLIA